MKSRHQLGSAALLGFSLFTAACANNSHHASTAPAAPHSQRPAFIVSSPHGQLTLATFQKQGARFGDVISLPNFERTPTQIIASADSVIADANAHLDSLAAQEPTAATFDSTMLALDDIFYPVTTTANRMFLIQETSTDESVRKAATEQGQRLSDWFTETQYRRDVYDVCKAFDDAYTHGQRPRLFGENLKLYKETMRDYRRAGLNLDAATRAQVEELQKERTALSTKFSTNITNANVTVYFTADEMAGAPASLLAQAKDQGKKDNGRQLFGVKATVTPQFVTAMQNFTSEAARKKLKIARYSIAQDENTPLLNDLIRVRDQIAHKLGYNSWDDYQIEPKMAKTGARAINFITDLKTGLEPKYQAEIAVMTAMKRAETGDPDVIINHWDWRYYENQLKKEKFNIDTEALRVYFPLNQVIDGLFGVYDEIFGINIQPMQAPWVWYDGVTLYAVSDSDTGEPLGMFYLDLFPREGKYNHFAQFDIIGGKQLRPGAYQRPVCSLVCNFTPPRGDAPSLLSHDEVETFFHEFGHAMHTILTRAKTSRFSGTNVPRDFVEAPSQMLQRWVWDTKVLDRFAADYRDPSKKIDPAILARMQDAKNATVATRYRRQLALAIADLWMHADGEYKDSAAIMQKAFAEYFLPAPPGTNMAAYWGHMTGYDAGYYGYAWADSIAADLATAFQNSPDGFMSHEIGRRLRNEIYATGGSRDVEKSIRAFLGRKRSIKPFLKKIGVEN